MQAATEGNQQSQPAEGQWETFLQIAATGEEGPICWWDAQIIRRLIIQKMLG